MSRTAWFTRLPLSGLLLAACTAPSKPTAQTIPASAFVVNLLATNTPTPSATPSSTPVPTLTPTPPPTRSPDAVCQELLHRLGALGFPSATVEAGIGADPQGQGNEMCWWRVSSTTANPDWPPIDPHIAASLGTEYARLTPVHGGILDGREVYGRRDSFERSDLSCARIEWHGRSVPDQPNSPWRQVEIACAVK